MKKSRKEITIKMREILFRGKRTDNGEWIEGFYVAANYHWHKYGRHRDWMICSAIANGGWFALGGKYPVIGNTVGQFTGLTDKNGKKIFEGDIVQGKDRLEKHLEVFGVIECKDGSFVIVGDFMTHYRWLDYDVEVIGNIHDNPELLKGGE
jgi:hypothetical protein